MSTVDNYESIDDRRYRSDRSERSHRHRDRRDEQPRYVETQETYVRSPVIAPDPPYAVRGLTTDVIRRPVREDSDLSVEEVRRDFPPPGAAAYVQQRTMIRDDRYGPPAPRTRSAERGLQYGAAYRDDPRRSFNDLDDRYSRKSTTYVDQEVKKEPRRRSLSRNEKIIAAVGGAALAVGGKELWDRRQADGRPVSRNALSTAAIGAAGALAGYEGAELYTKHVGGIGGKEEKVKTYVAHRGRNGEMAEYFSSDEESDKPKKKSRRKSIVEGALGLAGLGAAAKASGGSRSRRGSDESRDTRARSRGGDRDRSPEGAAKYQQAAKAALMAGALEAFRVRNEPGGWGGEKAKRIFTAAAGAGGIDAVADRNPEKHSKRHILEAVVGGLAANRVVNGSRNNIEEDDDGKSTKGSRSRSRSRSRAPGGGSSSGPLAALATAGLGALAAKKLTDRSRSRSRADDSRRRRDSRDSYDSRSPSPRGGKDRRKRSKSVSDYARKGLAALGIGEAVRETDRDRGDVEYEETSVRRSHKSRGDRSRSRGPDDGYGARGSRYGDSSRDVGYADDRGDSYSDSRYADSRASNTGSRNGGGRKSAREKDGRKNRRIAEGKEEAGSESDSSLGSSSGDEKRIKKMKGKQLLTAGLATVATIHAAHNIYQSMEKRNARHKAVQEGEMTPEEARKLKAKATLQDAASVGIAALGIKGAISEIKEANEMRHECREFREKKEERHKKRLERQKASKATNKSNTGRRRASENYQQAPNSRRYDDDASTRYTDGNPYASTIPAPPVGYYDGGRYT